MKKNRSLQANLQAAKTAVHEMVRRWHQWKEAHDSAGKEEAIAGYAAAYINCQVFIENYLKQVYPNENKLPLKVAQDIRKLVSEIDVIEKTNDKKLNQAIHDIDQIGKNAA
jgi:hypothetical protein